MTEDLTKLNYNRLMELSKDDKVERCFTQNGKIKFSLKDDPDKKLYTDTIGWFPGLQRAIIHTLKVRAFYTQEYTKNHEINPNFDYIYYLIFI